jgi:hypothetical protein
LAFSFWLTTVSVKNILLAGYVAVQHFAWDVMDVMTIQVGLRGRFAWVFGKCDIFASRQKRQVAMTFQVAVKIHGYYNTSFFHP